MNKSKMSTGYKIFNIFNILLMIFLCAIMIYPYLNQVAISFNEGVDTARGGIGIFPRRFTLENYATILKDSGISTSALVSVSRTILNLVFSLIATFSAAFALTRQDLKGKKGITLYFVVTMYISAGTIPLYILYRYLGLINNFWVYVAPYLFSVYNMLIFRSFISGLPKSLEESALLDGANEIYIMFKIIMPLSKPVLATVALWVAVAQWNDYMTTLYYITDKNLFTLQYQMIRIIKQGETIRQQALEMAMNGGEDAIQSKVTSEAVKSAMLIITTIPIICLYPFLQKYFVKGVTLGAVKG